MAEGARAKAGGSYAQTPALLKGILFDAEGPAIFPSHILGGEWRRMPRAATERKAHDASWQGCWSSHSQSAR